MTYVMTDDPADPCALCVHWDEPDYMDSGNFEDAVPYIAPGVKAERIFKYTHDACDAAVTAYMAMTDR